MTTKVQGTTGIEFPDSSVQSSAAYTKAESDGPAFRAVRTGLQTGIPSNTPVKVQLNIEDFDTAGAFDNSVNYRFQPAVPGYYQINAAAYLSGVSITLVQCLIRKNGSDNSTVFFSGPAAGDQKLAVSSVVYLNGTTDYVELWAAATGGTVNFGAGSFLSGFLARKA